MIDRNRIIELCEEIRTTKCICGGSFKQSTCKYCGQKNEKLEKKYRRIKKISR